MKKILLLVIAVVFAINTAYASPMITAFLYDPNGTDTGQEWIELYNPSDETVDLSTYSVQRGNGAKENDWLSVWNGSGQIIQPYGYYLIAEFTQADSTVKLVLGNGPDAIRLQNNQLSVETIGYGIHTFEEYYQESPAADVSNKPLIRTKDPEYTTTGDNSVDFLPGPSDYVPKTSSYLPPIEINTTQKLELELVIQNQPPKIESVVIPDDDLIRAGIQQVVLSQENLTISLLVSDSDGLEDLTTITVKLKKDGIVLSQNTKNSTNQSAHTIQLPLEPTYVAGRYELEVSATDEIDTTTYTTQLTIVPAIGITVSQPKLSLVKTNATLYQGTLSIQNTANSPVRIEIKLDALPFKYNLSISDGVHILNASTLFATSLNSTQSRVYTVQLVPTQAISKGTYTTNITAVAHAVN
ncbi:MAG TPA: lamin tail domain-containing protein [Acidobacteriota bacterium]|nr:lamin tail domain-containing protein [Acidobacteriota bacterium]